MLRDGLADDAEMQNGRVPEGLTPGDWFVLHGIWDGRAIVDQKRQAELEAKARNQKRY